MKIKTPEEVLDIIACGKCYRDIYHAMSGSHAIALEIIKKAMEAYAYQMCEAQKQKCTEKAEIKKIKATTGKLDPMFYEKVEVDIDSILNTPNVCNPKTKDDEKNIDR